MNATLTVIPSLEQITTLLDRLDPQIGTVCEVAGCVHHHEHHPSQCAAGEAGTV